MVVALFRTLEFKKSQLPILISIDGSFYFTQVSLVAKKRLALVLLVLFMEICSKIASFRRMLLFKSGCKGKNF